MNSTKGSQKQIRRVIPAELNNGNYLKIFDSWQWNTQESELIRHVTSQTWKSQLNNEWQEVSRNQ